MLPTPILGGITPYSLMFAIGFLTAIAIYFLYTRMLHTDRVTRDIILEKALISVFVGIISAMLFQSLYAFIDDPSQGFGYRGITFLGGLFGGSGAFLLLYRHERKKSGKALLGIIPILPCCVCIAHAFGRIGCFLSGCCYGKPTDSMLGVKFPMLPERVHPTQLYEAGFLFLLFGILSFLAFRRQWKFNIVLYFLAYGAFRFFIEFLRGDERGSLIPGLSPSQFLSLLLILGGILWIIFENKIYKMEENHEDCSNDTM